MGKDSKIEWTHHTFSPWEGCTKVSPGCANCYAESTNKRWGRDNWGKGKPRLLRSPAYWNQPYKWDAAAKIKGERHRVFCASVADVFDAEAPPGALNALWTTIKATPHLDWLLLTKRPERIQGSLPYDWGTGWSNVWLGTSVEDQKRAEERIPILARVPARIRFLSCEPLLGPIDVRGLLVETRESGRRRDIHWVICGGESGRGARPMDLAWARSLRDQCQETGTAYFMKQVGSRAALVTSKGGSEADIPPDLLIREWPEVAT